jgi:hypothetical protein
MRMDEHRVFLKRVIEGKFMAQWEDGLCLEPPALRAQRMHQRALEKFRGELDRGTPLHEACDIALGVSTALRGDLTYIHREGVTPPAKVQGEDPA